ncbi:MAG: carbon-nitrogen hydrolase family protein [Pseudomonadota bacterium]
MEQKIKTALIQYEIQPSWSENMDRVEALLRTAKSRGARLAVLPEFFNMPYDMSLVPELAEDAPGGRTCARLAQWARDLEIVLVGGTIAEKEGGRFFNTATVWDRDGRLLAKRRKVHLFDVDLPGGVSFRESAVLSPGDEIAVVEVLGIKLGVAVCYDIRFPETFRLLALQGADFAALPGAFNHVSGPAHWEILLRCRAMENTFYTAGVSGLSPVGSNYHAWGHSMMVDPFGEVTVNLGRAEGLGLAEIDPARIREVRDRLPFLRQRRQDLYRLELLGDRERLRHADR